jgi:hypothetical protein
MSRFFKATFSINISSHLPHEYTFKVGFDHDIGQEFIVGNSERFFEIMKFLKGKNIFEFDRIDFCHWNDGGDDATLEMFHIWESGLKGYAHKPVYRGGYYHFNGEPFNTLYHATEYAKQCDSEVSDDNVEYCEREREFLVHGNDLFDL